MKGSTKFWLGASAAAGGIWAWMRYGSRTTLAASRVVPPGYVRSENIFDAAGRQFAVRFIYPFIESDSVGKFARVLVVPIDPNQRGTWTTIREPMRAPL